MDIDRPWFVLVAGINGAGKSTVAQDSSTLSFLTGEVGSPLEIINPDKVTQDLRTDRPKLSLQEANQLAAQACEARVDQLIARGQHSFAIETVLSTDKYKRRVSTARQQGFEVFFIYLALPSPERAIERVKLRVSNGGHDVPEAKIRKRWPLSLSNVPWFWENSSASFVFYNDDPFLKLAQRRNDEVTFNRRAPTVVQPLLKRLLPQW